MSDESLESLIGEIDPVDYVKPLTALTASGLVGFILGINYTVGAVWTDIPIAAAIPPWMGEVKLMQWVVICLLAVVVGAWIYIDYTERVDR